MSKKRGKEESSKGDTLSYKDYRKALLPLHVELVKLQEWVVTRARRSASSSKDAMARARAASSRRSPSASVRASFGSSRCRSDRTGKVADVHSALPAASAGGGRGRDLRPQLVQPRRRRTRDGLLHGGAGEALPERGADRGTGDHRFRRDPAQILARGEPGGADASARGAHRRRPQDLEAVDDGSEVLQPLVRLFPGARRHVRGDRHGMAPWYVAIRRQTARAGSTSSAHLLGQIPYEAIAAQEGEAPEAASSRRAIRAPDYPFKFITEEF